MEKFWVKSYQQGVPAEINPNEYASIVALFNESCLKYPHHIAYRNLNSTLTYAEVQVLSQQLARYLQTLGLEKGARIAIMMPNILQYPIAVFAILQAGFTVVNINPLYTCDELRYQLCDSGAAAILVMANFAKTLEEALLKTPTLQHVIITEMGDLFSPIKRWVVNAVVKYIKRMIPSYRISNAVSFRTALKHGARAKALVPLTLTHQDIAFIQYTGGTTGVSKGAMLTHGNMVANVQQASAWIAPLSINDQDIVVTALPLYHIFSLTANLFTFFKVGAQNILITNPRDLSAFIKEIKNSRLTAITGVNTLFNALLHHPNFTSIDFSALKLALSGGMALQKSVSLRWHELTRSPILEAYGLTETSPAVTINPMYLTDYNGSIGLPLPSTDISIRDEHGREVPFGQPGELCIKGPQVMPSYWHNPDETAHVFWPDGFLRTGDVVNMDEAGFIYLLDRIKDMILVSGFNVYPNEVEQVIGLMPGVREVGVVGTKDEQGIEKVRACIVKRDPALTAEDVLTYARAHLTAYKVPKIIEFYNELPKTNVGKIIRRAL